MRWGQAWMLLATATVLEAKAQNRVEESATAQPQLSGAFDMSAYVIITPARNEAAFIELTLKSMVAQAIKPLRWVIVSDGST